MKNFKRVGIAGDWHSDKNWGVRMLERFARAGVTEILHVGDFNFWNDARGRSYLEVLNRVADRHNQTIWVTEGNHEDYVLLETYVPHPEHDGWKYDPTYPNILVAVRGVRWNWNGVSFLSIGGANSINRYSLTPNINWWEGEQISLGDVYRAIQDGTVDVVISHDAPLGVNLFGTHRDADEGWSAEGIAYARKSRESLRQVVDVVKPRMLFHGHFHFWAVNENTFKDWEGTDYTFTSYGLDMNGCQNNIGVLDLDTMEFTTLNRG